MQSYECTRYEKEYGMKVIEFSDVDLEIIEKLVNIELVNRESDNSFGFGWETQPFKDVLQKVRQKSKEE